MRDDKLLNILQTDPERGMRVLIDSYGGLVHAIVRAKLSSSVFCTDDVEACVADTFSEFYMDRSRYSASLGSIRAWLCVIAKHNAVDYLRRYYKTAQIISLDDESCTEYADDFSLEGDFEKQKLRCELISAIRKLGMPDREILMRKYFMEQNSKEIAAVLHLTVSNVDTRTHRAICKLRKQFGGDLK